MTGKLAKLGFSKDVIIETIVSTYDAEGQPNAAPMGVTMESARRITIRPYIPTLTYKNLQQQKCAVINITSNPELYYRTTFKEVNPRGILPQEFFEKAEVVNAPKLRGADAHIEATVVNMSTYESERATVHCQVKRIKAPKKLPTAYCRATAATIEAIIHATRVKALCSNKNEQEHVQKLLEMIENCSNIINRVAPHSRYSEIMVELNKRIKKWRAESESLR